MNHRTIFNTLTTLLWNWTEVSWRIIKKFLHSFLLSHKWRRNSRNSSMFTLSYLHKPAEIYLFHWPTNSLVFYSSLNEIKMKSHSIRRVFCDSLRRQVKWSSLLDGGEKKCYKKMQNIVKSKWLCCWHSVGRKNTKLFPASDMRNT